MAKPKRGLKINIFSNGIKQQYKLVWKFLKESINYILFSLVLFFIFASFGFFGIKNEVIEQAILKIISELIEKTKDMNFFQLFLFILENNLSASFSGMLLGVFFGIVPIVIVITNGYILGYVARKSVELGGYNVLFKLFPHGIFELPAVIISIALGIKLTRFIFSKKRKEKFKYDLENSLRVFLFVILPLLIAAGFIEAVFIFMLR